MWKKCIIFLRWPLTTSGDDYPLELAKIIQAWNPSTGGRNTGPGASWWTVAVHTFVPPENEVLTYSKSSHDAAVGSR